MAEFTAEYFAEMSEGAQSEIMREWFLDNYEDPVHSLPYESREGGYIWIYGGPYDAGQVLQEKFGGLVPEWIIDQLADELFDESPQWVGKDHLYEDDDYLFDYGLEPTTYFDEYQQAMDRHRTLLRLAVPQETENRFYGMIFVNLITMMEAYLSDAFIGEVLQSEGLMRKFVASSQSCQK